MKYDKERALLSKIIEEGNDAFRKVLKSKVTAEYFSDLENREMFVYLLGTFHKYGQVPSLELVRGTYGEFHVEETRDNIPLIVDALREKKIYNEIQSALGDINRESRASSRDALRLMQEFTGQITQDHLDSEDRDLTKCADDILASYEANKTLKGMVGIPYIWNRANKNTRGKQRGQLITYYGRSGTLKTWMALADAAFSHSACGKVPLFITREMLIEEIAERWAVIRARVDYGAYQDGKLNQEEEKRLRLTMEQMKDEVPFHTATVNSSGQTALAEIRALVESYDAELLYIDGLYFYAPGGDYKLFGNFVEGLKNMSLALKISTIGTNQANTKKPKDGLGQTDDVASGQSMVHFSDVLVRTFCEPQHEEKEELVLKFKKIRNSKPCTFTIHAKPGISFEQKYDEEDEESLNDALGDDEGILG